MARLTDVSTGLDMERQVGSTQFVAFETGLLRLQEIATGRTFEYRGDLSVDGLNNPIGSIQSIMAQDAAGKVEYRLGDFSVGFVEILALSDSNDIFAVDRAILSGDDTLEGSSDNDTVVGYGQIEGGGDTYVLSGERADYRGVQIGEAVQVTDLLVGRDGTDTLRDVEFARFTDGIFPIEQLLIPPPTVSVGDIVVNEEAQTATFTVSLNSVAPFAITLTAATTLGTALSAGSGPGEPDFAATAETVSFPGGSPASSTRQVTVPITNDAVAENAEQFTLTLTSADAARIDAAKSDLTATATINDDDPRPNVSIADVIVNEAAGTAALTVVLTGASDEAVVLTATSSDLTALAAGDGPGTPDYTATTQTLTFPSTAEATQFQSITIPIVDDAVFERNEAFAVTLTSTDSAAIDANSSDLASTVTIVDDDPQPTVSVADISVVEDAILQGRQFQVGSVATFTLTLSGVSEEDVVLGVQTVDGTAVSVSAGAGTPDYQAIPDGSAVIFGAGGPVNRSVAVQLIPDSTDETVETFSLRLSAADPTSINAAGSDLDAVATILDNDGRISNIAEAVMVVGMASNASDWFLI
jgi:Calx-beta domain